MPADIALRASCGLASRAGYAIMPSLPFLFFCRLLCSASVSPLCMNTISLACSLDSQAASTFKV
eukprot:6187038-Pleurochrysis_carterae.AAC.3